MYLLRRSQRRSFCEWKGEAVYFDVLIEGEAICDVAWSYPRPTAALGSLRDHIRGLLPRRRASDPAARRVLRWMDHLAGGRSLQARAWQPAVVTCTAHSSRPAQRNGESTKAMG